MPGSVIEEEQGKLYNTTYYIEANGKVKARYRKINLWHPERRYISVGREVAVCSTRYGKVGLMICWDLMFPEIFRAMLTKGVEIVICPSYWTFEDATVGLRYDTKADVKLIDSLCAGRAFENEIVFVYCNAAGRLRLPGIEERLLGRSQIAVPFKGAIAKLEHNREEMFIREIDTAIIKDAEKAYGIRSDLRKMGRERR